MEQRPEGWSASGSREASWFPPRSTTPSVALLSRVHRLGPHGGLGLQEAAPSRFAMWVAPSLGRLRARSGLFVAKKGHAWHILFGERVSRTYRGVTWLALGVPRRARGSIGDQILREPKRDGGGAPNGASKETDSRFDALLLTSSSVAFWRPSLLMRPPGRTQRGSAFGRGY